jgi:hypothetical protein
MEKFVEGFPFKDTVFDGQAISGEETVYTDPMPIVAGGNIGVWYKATSVLGTPQLRLFYEVGPDETLANFAIPEGAVDICSLFSGEGPYVASFSSPPMPYIRYAVKGMTGNAVDTLLTEVVVNV